MLSRLHTVQGSREKAKIEAKAAIEANSKTISNYLLLASLYEAEENWEQARKTYETARKIDSDSPIVANNLAYFYLQHGNNPELALELAQEAKQKWPNSPATGDTLGWAYYKRGLHDLAILQMEESIRKAPDNPTYHYHLGMAYLANDQANQGRQSLLRSVQLDPEFAEAAQAREALKTLP